MIDLVIEKLISLLGPLKDLSKERRELRDNALRSISHALNETFLYYSGIERGKARDHDIEAQLSKYWAAAAIPMRHLDESLSAICEQKSDYWINPDHWTKAKVNKYGIALDDVRRKYRELLHPRLTLSNRYKKIK